MIDDDTFSKENIAQVAEKLELIHNAVGPIKEPLKLLVDDYLNLIFKGKAARELIVEQQQHNLVVAMVRHKGPNSQIPFQEYVRQAKLLTQYLNDPDWRPVCNILSCKNKVKNLEDKHCSNHLQEVEF